MKLSDFFSQQGKPWMVMEGLTRILVINALVVVSSLGIVTVGASLTAAYTVLIVDDTDEDDEGYEGIWRRYWGAFRKKWKNSTLGFLAFLACGALLICAVFALRENAFQYAPLVGLAIILLGVQVYFPLTAVSDLGLGESLGASFFLVLKCTMQAILATLLWVAMAAAPIFFPKLTFLWLFAGVGIAVTGTAKLMTGVMAKANLIAPKEAQHAGV